MFYTKKTLSLFGHKHCRIVYHLLQYKDEEDCTLRPGPAAEVAASLFLVPHTPWITGLHVLLEGDLWLLLLTCLLLELMFQTDIIGIPFSTGSVLPYMEKIKLLTALHLRTHNNLIMSTVIMLQVSTAAVLYKECNLTVFWGKKLYIYDIYHIYIYISKLVA